MAVVLVQLAVLIGRVKLHCMEWYFSALFVVQYVVQYIMKCVVQHSGKLTVGWPSGVGGGRSQL